MKIEIVSPTLTRADVVVDDKCVATFYQCDTQPHPRALARALVDGLRIGTHLAAVAAAERAGVRLHG